MIEKIAFKMQDELITIRRQLHKIPEIAFEEFQTSKCISDRLTEMGIEHETVAKTGIVGIIRGKQDGKTLLIRADIDGLPVEEQIESEFKSQRKGYMHACGHDVHIACLLGTAKILNDMKDSLKGNLKLVFQPAEEGVGGALPMIEEGIMYNPKVDASIALHVEPFEKAGNIQVKSGPIMASPDDFEMVIHGKGGHGAYPHLCVDPILVGSMIVNAYQTIVSRHFDPMTPAVVSVCSFESGSCTNVIPEEARLSGTARSLDKETRKEMIYILEKIAVDTAKSMGAACDFKFKPLYPPLINDKKMNKLLIKSAEELTCVKEIVELETPSMAGDDFSYFADLVPSVYFKLGIGNLDESLNHALHHSKFCVNEDALYVGVAVITKFAINYLND